MPNALIRESSPYLRKLAQQPVHWFSWSDAALAKARNENKMILLSIGAAWCHWCHVMDRESFEDPEIAELINEHFVAIKIDRDEHPEVDRYYQAALVALNGQAGWPVTAFLTPTAELCAGGTYFPPDMRFGQKGLRTVLKEIAETARTAPASLEEIGRQIRRGQSIAATSDASPPETTPEYVEKAVRTLVREFDFAHGGFGEAPRFPHSPALEALLAASFRSRDPNHENLVRKALESMACGGIHDHLGGGFHRYATDDNWALPHFEKILADNAELLRLYTRAFIFHGDSFYRETAEGIINWTRQCMSDRDGGFYNSQGADAGPDDDGGFYSWTLEEARALLTEKELQIITSYYNIRNATGPNILRRDRTLEDIADEFKILPVTVAGGLLTAAREKLYWARKKRAEPSVDPVLYIHSNARMISALLEAGYGLGLPDCQTLAYRALDRIVREGWSPGNGFSHSLTNSKPHLRGLLEDQVFGALALLDAYADSGDSFYLQQATATANLLTKEYEDKKNGGFFDTAHEHRTEVTSLKPMQDTPTASGNGAAVVLFHRLHSMTAEPAYQETAERTFEAATKQVHNWGAFAGTFVVAAQYLVEGAFEVFILGDPRDPTVENLRLTAWQTYRPRRDIRIMRSDSAIVQPAVQGMIDFIRQKSKTMAFVCVQGSCAAPVSEPEALRNLMLTFNP